MPYFYVKFVGMDCVNSSYCNFNHTLYVWNFWWSLMWLTEWIRSNDWPYFGTSYYFLVACSNLRSELNCDLGFKNYWKDNCNFRKKVHLILDDCLLRKLAETDFVFCSFKWHKLLFKLSYWWLLFCEVFYDSFRPCLNDYVFFSDSFRPSLYC